MKPKELRDLTYSELEHRLRETKEGLFNLRVEFSSGKLENPLKIREAKRDIARIETIMKEVSPPVAGGQGASGREAGKEEGKKKSEDSR
jgi:large subunit ribosomal protein L29